VVEKGAGDNIRRLSPQVNALVVVLRPTFPFARRIRRAICPVATVMNEVFARFHGVFLQNATALWIAGAVLLLLAIGFVGAISALVERKLAAVAS